MRNPKNSFFYKFLQVETRLQSCVGLGFCVLTTSLSLHLFLYFSIPLFLHSIPPSIPINPIISFLLSLLYLLPVLLCCTDNSGLSPSFSFSFFWSLLLSCSSLQPFFPTLESCNLGYDAGSSVGFSFYLSISSSFSFSPAILVESFPFPPFLSLVNSPLSLDMRVRESEIRTRNHPHDSCKSRKEGELEEQVEGKGKHGCERIEERVRGRSRQKKSGLWVEEFRWTELLSSEIQLLTPCRLFVS